MIYENSRDKENVQSDVQKVRTPIVAKFVICVHLGDWGEDTQSSYHQCLQGERLLSVQGCLAH
jgi:hypothetical protein